MVMCHLRCHLNARTDAAKKGDLFATDAGCPNATLSCLLDLDINTILDAQTKAQNHYVITELLAVRSTSHHIITSSHHITSHHITSHRCGQMFMPWTPVVDGKELIGQPIDLIAAGIYNKVQHITYHCLDFSHADAGCARYHWRRGRRGWVFKHPYALTGSDMHECQAACLSGS